MAGGNYDLEIKLCLKRAFLEVTFLKTSKARMSYHNFNNLLVLRL